VLRIAVTGAGGQIGGQVVRLLAGEQAHQVVALSRVLPSGRWPAGVSARAADYADPEALSAALRGADTLVFVSSDGPVAQVMVHHHNVIRAARAGGVAHIVALSGLDADPASPFCYAVSYGYTERLLAESGCLVSIARASIYSEFFTGFLARARASGQVRLPAADGRISLVARADVAVPGGARGQARERPPRHHRP
jgi:NAD(P)H dehydrogenase (quinone)